MSEEALINLEGGGEGAPPPAAAKSEGGQANGRIYEEGGERYDVPENFWDAKANEGKGAPRIGALLKANGDLRKQISDAKPKTPETYELVVPEALKDKIKANPDDPLAKAAFDFAKKHGLSQEAFNSLAAMHYQQLAGEAETEAQFTAKQSQQLDAALGDKAKEVKAELGAWVGGLLGEDFKKNPEILAEAQALVSSAAGVLLVKAIKDKIGEHGVPSAKEAPTAPVALSDLKTLQASVAYRDSNHPDHAKTVKQVEEGFKRLYPSKK